MPKLKDRRWDIVLCLSSEERSLGITEHILKDTVKSAHVACIDVIDPISKYTTEIEALKQGHRSVIAPFVSEFHKLNLLDSPALLVEIMDEIITKSNGNMILDTSVFPKRFFFPMIRNLMEDIRIKNLIVTYTAATGYSTDLSDEVGPWQQLPSFNAITYPAVEIKHVIVGVGFMAGVLPTLLKDYRDARVSLLFPFPPGPPYYKRNWDFVRAIESEIALQDRQIIRINALDLSGCFDHIFSITNHATENAIFAPYGPKSQSLAMCLFAIRNNCEVFYSQPHMYYPNYSIGMKMASGLPETYAYHIKLNGDSLY